MAPTRVSARKQKESDYSNVGHVGRKTGVTLPDTGVRDQHGLPPLPEMDTLSPGESEPGRTANGNATLTESEMEIGHSTIAEPKELLSAKRPRMPPPRSRSPIKTSLGSSPRRSTGHRKSSARLSNGSQHHFDPPNSTPVVNVVDADGQGPQALHVEDANSPSRAVVARKRGRKPKNRAEQPLKRPFQQIESEVHDSVLEQIDEDDQPSMLEPPDSSQALALEEASIEEPTADLDDLAPVQTSTTEAVGEDATQAQAVPVPEKGKRGRPKKQPQPDPKPDASAATKSSTRPNSKTTRSERSNAVDVFREPEDEVEEGPAKPSKRPKVDRAPKKKPPPAARHPNATIKSKAGRSAAAATRGRKGKASTPPQPLDDGGHEVPEDISAVSGSAMPTSPPAPSPEVPTRRTSRPKPRSLTLLRSETPQDAAQYTRSGRTSVKPCAFWRNERVVYGEAKADGQRLSLPGVKEVIRTEEVVEEPASTTTRKKARRKEPVEGVLKDDGHQSKWERESGNLVANVMAWDPYEGKASGEELEQIELAVAPKGFEELIKEVKNQKFRYAKTVALPFFHSGMVDLPPGGEKRVKNSRRNHMVFWVFSGRVKVDINGLKFSIGRGGMWQVPRGNFYGLRNPGKQAARIFFAQGCYMNEAEVEAEDDAGSVEGAAEGSIPA